MKLVAEANKVVLPMAMDPANRTLYEELSGLSGPEFDREYMLGQINIQTMGKGALRERGAAMPKPMTTSVGVGCIGTRVYFELR